MFEIILDAVAFLLIPMCSQKLFLWKVPIAHFFFILQSEDMNLKRYSIALLRTLLPSDITFSIFKPYLEINGD